MSSLAYSAGRQHGSAGCAATRQRIQVASGVLLIAMGVLVLTGQLFRLNIEAQKLLDGAGLNFFRSL